MSEGWTLLLDIFALFFGNHLNHFVFDSSSLSCFSSVALCIPQNINLLVGVVCVVACIVLCYGQGILYEFPESPNPNLTFESIRVDERLPLSYRSWLV